MQTKMAEESLSAAFSSKFNISFDANDPSTPHPRLSQFKNKNAVGSGQDYRRAQMFERQKMRRLDAVNYARKLVQGELTEEDLDDPLGVAAETKIAEKRFNPYKNQLMLSEWLVEVPEDFQNEWIMTVSPVGKRCLVVANRGHTAAYTKSGFCVNRFPSLLPGGSRRTLRPGEYTILDCIYNEVEHTFFVIDLTCWKGHPVYDSETEFRFYWLKVKFNDQPDLQKRSAVNPYIFTPAPNCSCNVSEIRAAATENYSFQVDGFLFYHKRTHYTPGRTPLVGWLKPYMIPPILGISLPDYITENRPVVNKLTLLQANYDSFRDPISHQSTKNGTTTSDESHVEME